MYKATLDWLSIVITIGCCLIIGILSWRSLRFLVYGQRDFNTIFLHLSITVILIGTLLLSFLFSIKNYQITSDKNLIIQRQMSKIVIPVNDIIAVKLIDDNEITGTIRKFGVGGLFGYYGLYYIPKIGNVKYYTTRRNNRILIVLKNKNKIVISPDDVSLIDLIKP
jgi:hypothetical protein